MDSGITTVNMLKEFMTVIFNKAIEDTASCPIYSNLLYDLNEKLPPLPSEKPCGKDITVKTILLNIFQDCFKAADENLISLGNIPFLGELFKQKLVPEWFVHQILDHLLAVSSLPNNYVEALCKLLISIGKQLDESPKSLKVINDMHFTRLKEFSTNKLLPSELRFMVCDVLKLRANSWIPLPRPVDEITYTDLNVDIYCMVDQYFTDRRWVHAVNYVDGMESPAYHPEFVNEIIWLTLTNRPQCVLNGVELLNDLFVNSVFSSKDIVQGCLLFVSEWGDIAPISESVENFGKMLGELVLAGCFDFMALRDIFREVVKYDFRDLVYVNFINVMSCYNLNEFLSL